MNSTNPNPPSRRLTTRQAAEYLGISPKTLSQKFFRLRHQIPHMQLGPRMLRFDSAQLDRWLQKRSVRYPPETPQGVSQEVLEHA
jgi:excisionase family DNA binding protein